MFPLFGVSVVCFEVEARLAVCKDAHDVSLCFGGSGAPLVVFGGPLYVYEVQIPSVQWEWYNLQSVQNVGGPVWVVLAGLFDGELGPGSDGWCVEGRLDLYTVHRCETVMYTFEE